MAKRTSHRHGRRSVHPDYANDTRWAPMTTSFMLTSILGFFISALYVSKHSVPLAVAFSLVFFCMFIACMISMARASPDAQLAARPIK